MGKVFEKHNIRELEKEFYESNPYNLEAVLTHILGNYTGDRPIYVGFTATPKYYQTHKEKMYISGLALKYSEKPLDLLEFNKNLIENKFHLDYLSIQMTSDRNQNNVNNLNKNYLHCFEPVYNDYKGNNQKETADKIKNLAIMIANELENKSLIDRVLQKYKE